MKCKWCDHVAVETIDPKGKRRDPFDNLKTHARKAHPQEYREWERSAWFSRYEGYRRIKKIRETMRRFA